MEFKKYKLGCNVRSGDFNEIWVESRYNVGGVYIKYGALEMF